MAIKSVAAQCYSSFQCYYYLYQHTLEQIFVLSHVKYNNDLECRSIISIIQLYIPIDGQHSNCISSLLTLRNYFLVMQKRTLTTGITVALLKKKNIYIYIDPPQVSLFYSLYSYRVRHSTVFTFSKPKQVGEI